MQVKYLKTPPLKSQPSLTHQYSNVMHRKHMELFFCSVNVIGSSLEYILRYINPNVHKFKVQVLISLLSPQNNKKEKLVFNRYMSDITFLNAYLYLPLDWLLSTS